MINEIDDGSGFGVETHELVELHNPTASALSLDGLAVVLFDGTTGREYERVSLFGSLAPGGYAAVTAPDPGTGFALSLPSGVPRFVFPGSGTIDRIRNSGTPNGAGLLDLASGMLVDFVTYEGTFASEALLDSVGAPLATIPLGRNDAIANDGWLPGMGARPSVPRSSSRATDGCDTGTPSADWVVTETTPGAPNVF